MQNIVFIQLYFLSHSIYTFLLPARIFHVSKLICEEKKLKNLLVCDQGNKEDDLILGCCKKSFKLRGLIFLIICIEFKINWDIFIRKTMRFVISEISSHLIKWLMIFCNNYSFILPFTRICSSFAQKFILGCFYNTSSLTNRWH